MSLAALPNGLNRCSVCRPSVTFATVDTAGAALNRRLSSSFGTKTLTVRPSEWNFNVVASTLHECSYRLHTHTQAVWSTNDADDYESRLTGLIALLQEMST